MYGEKDLIDALLNQNFCCMRKVLLLGLTFLWANTLVFGQSRTVTGTVTSGEDGLPFPGVSVIVKGTTLGMATDLDGRYSLSVPEGSNVLVFSFIGMATVEEEIGARSVINVTLEPDVETLGEVIVTGLAAGTPEKKLSFSVGKVGEDFIQRVPAVDAAGALQGKVAGLQIIPSSRPGTAPQIQLRGASSFPTDPENTSGNSGPLIVVDGVLTEGSLQDINVQDVERIEVLKGASGAALFGSRAANGVIQIFTRRGGGNAIGETQVRIRNEFGASRAYNSRAPKKTRSHHFFTNPDGTIRTNPDADPINEVILGIEDTIMIQDVPFVEPLYDHVAEMFGGGEFMTNYAAVTHRGVTSNLLASFEHQRNTGPMDLNDGQRRSSFRLNMDQYLGDKLKLTASTMYSMSTRDDNILGGNGTRNAIRNLFMMDPSANLLEENENGEPYRWNINKFGNSEGNPLYTLSRYNRDVEAKRFIGNFGGSYELTDGLTLEYAFGLDNRESLDSRFLNKGHLDITAGDSPRLGAVERYTTKRTATTSTATLVYLKNFGDLNFRSRAYYMYENNEYEDFNVRVNTLTISGINRLENGQNHLPARSWSERVTANNFALVVGGDWKDKYIIDALVRREAVSLFGANERWQTFSRVSLAYRLSEDINLPGFDEFSLRGSFGTAGGRPPFSAQYSARGLSGEGTVSTGGTLGNPDLRPNITEELEVGINAEFLNIFTLNAAYSEQNNMDQIMRVPLSSGSGWDFQWQNAGTLKTSTWEATLGIKAVQTADVGLDFNLVVDRTRQDITKYEAADQLLTTDQFDYGVLREGLPMGNFFGQKHAKSLEEVANQVPEGQTLAETFEVNSDGYVIRAGTQYTVDEAPVLVRNDDGSPWQGLIGNMFSDVNLGFNTSFRFKGLDVYMLWQAQIGGDVYNRGAQWMARDNLHPFFDQAGVPENQKKRMSYYKDRK